jgi:hypothetical protein
MRIRSAFTKRVHLWLVIVLAGLSLGATQDRTIYSNTSNKELKQKAFALVKSIRTLVDSYNKKDRELMTEYDKKNRKEIPIDERKATRGQWIRESDAVHDSTMRYYRDHYWSEAILLVDELYRRVPKRLRQTNVLPIYQHPTNVLGLETIANHLELLSKSLPDS